MKFNGFKRSAKVLGAVLIAANLSGCGSVINEGNFGIERYWGGEYNEVISDAGYKFNVFDKIFEVYGRESMIKIDDVRPKDKDNIMLKDLDLNVTFKILKEGAIKFVLKTGDIALGENNGEKVYFIGKKYLAKDAQSIIGTTIKKYSSEEVLNNPKEIETAFQQDLQKELDTLYGKGTFEIVDIKLANIQVSDNIEEKIQAISVVKSEKAKSEAIQSVLEIREKTLGQELKVLKKASEASGVTVDQLLTYETIKAIKESNGNGTDKVKLNVDVKAKP